VKGRYPFVVLAILALLLSGGNYFFTNTEVGKLQTSVLASCAFAADIGTVPIPAKPRPSKLGVQLVADSRAQWRKLGCPGSLPVPPGFARWAAVYHLPSS